VLVELDPLLERLAQVALPGPNADEITAAAQREQAHWLHVLLRGALFTLSAVATPPVDRHPSPPRERGPGLFSIRLPFPAPAPQPSEPVTPRPEEPMVDMRRLLPILRSILEAADGVLAAAEPPPPPAPELLPWDKDKDLIDLSHQLLEAGSTQDGKEALLRIEDLRGQLAARGIRTITFDGGNSELFQFLRNPDPDDMSHTTVRPALVVGGQILRRGQVRGPEPATTAPSAPAAGAAAEAPAQEDPRDE
jgi:hypothetical protein